MPRSVKRKIPKRKLASPSKITHKKRRVKRRIPKQKLASPSQITHKKRARSVKRKLASPSQITHKKRSPIRRKRIMTKILQRMARPCYYTGKEPSPKGYGRCAHNEPFAGIVAKGTDGHPWITEEVIIKGRRILRWVRV